MNSIANFEVFAKKDWGKNSKKFIADQIYE
jgi:hypothetical protein